MRKYISILVVIFIMFTLCSCDFRLSDSLSESINDWFISAGLVEENQSEETTTTTSVKQNKTTKKNKPKTTTKTNGQKKTTKSSVGTTTTTSSKQNVTTKKDNTTTVTEKSTTTQTTTTTSTAYNDYDDYDDFYNNDVTPQKSFWDGVSAQIWLQGTGTAGDPYVIASAENLAYLARESAYGNKFTDKYFILAADIDLGNYAWTPIGTRTAPFYGSFDGDGYTISNINLSKGVKNVASETEYERRGLFGHVVNCTISNLYIDGVKVNISSTALDADVYYVGGLIGYAEADYACVVENCHVKNVSFNFSTSAYKRVYIGSVVGYSTTSQNASMGFSGVFADSKMTISSSADNRVGGIVGYLNLNGVASFTNVCSYLQISQSTTRGTYYVSPLIGVVNTEKGKLNLASCYSSLCTNERSFNLTGSSGYQTRACGFVGELFGTFKGKSKFVNSFATVTVGNGATDYTSQFPLYSSSFNSYGALTTNNCQAVTILPETCGFKPSVWDLSDMSRPTLK